MFIPILPSTTIINKTIVYSDTVLPLSDVGNNLKITSVSNVNESSFEDCLRIIFESNSSVVFNTIQYSKNEKKVYFYTDKEISINKWLESNIKTYKPISSSSEIIEEVDNLLCLVPPKENDCVSLLQVATIIKKMHDIYNATKKQYQLELDKIMDFEYKKNNMIVLHDFDYSANELTISISEFDEWKRITFSKENGDLYIKRYDTYYCKNILSLLGNKISEVYDVFMGYKDYMEQYNYNIKPINSNFFVSVSHYDVSIFTKSPSNEYMSDFVLSLNSSNGKYDYKCNSLKIINSLQVKESIIFSKIYIHIDDCPQWIRPILYELRKNELEEQNSIIYGNPEKKKSLLKKALSYFKD